VLSIEHRAAASPEPLLLSLVADAGPVRLDILDQPVELPLTERLLRILDDGEPRRLEDLRQTLRARKQDVSAALRELEATGQVVRSEVGYRRLRS
jgi:DNA-binding MarR family transcriptional regulator